MNDSRSHRSGPVLFTPPPTLGTARDVFRPDDGWALRVVYAVTTGVVPALYPGAGGSPGSSGGVGIWWLSCLQGGMNGMDGMGTAAC